MGEITSIPPCPFCGAKLEKTSETTARSWHMRPIWFHPGVVTGGDCLLSGRGFYAPELLLWRKRTAVSPGNYPI